MDDKEVSEVKEEKKGKSRGGFYFLLVVVIVLIVIIVGYYFFNSSQTSGLQNQISQLKENNTNLNSQLTGFSIAIDSLKNFSQSAKSGSVPFWDQNSNDITFGIIPLNSYSAKILSQNIILKNSQNLANNYTFKSVTKNKSIWTSNFMCADVNDSSCFATVVIDESSKSYNVTS
jgi:hypothetical protein